MGVANVVMRLSGNGSRQNFGEGHTVTRKIDGYNVVNAVAGGCTANAVVTTPCQYNTACLVRVQLHV